MSKPQQHAADPFDLPPRFLPARRKSSLHRIGPGVESQAIEMLCDAAEIELAADEAFALLDAGRLPVDDGARRNFGEGEEGDRWEGLS